MGTPFLQPREFYAQPTPPAPPTYTDRSTGLMAFGIVQIVCGAVTALFIPLAVFGAVMASKTGLGAPLKNLAPSLFIYALTAVVLIVLGVGSTQKRRWARALVLVVSWVWLVTGFFTVVLTAYIFPQMMRARIPGGTDPMAKTIVAVVATAMIVFMALFMVALPGGLVIFYRQRDVEETCKHRDPVERWTDRTPLPVLAISLLFAFGALYFVVIGLSTPLFPFFGRYMVGMAGTALCVAVAVLDGVLAFGFFRRSILAWWVAVVMLLVRIASAVLTYRTGNLMEAYSRMGWSEKQTEILRQNPALGAGAMLWTTLAFSLVFLGYLIWVKRFFDPPEVPSNPVPEPSLPSAAV